MSYDRERLQELGRKGGRVRKPRWRFGTDDIARAAGVSVWTVRRAMKANEVDCNDLGSLAGWIVRRREESGQALCPKAG